MLKDYTLAVDTESKDEESGSNGEREAGEAEKGAITHNEGDGQEISEMRKAE